MKGRALVDIASFGVACGEYVDLPKGIAEACAAEGSFDPKAVIPDGVTVRKVGQSTTAEQDVPATESAPGANESAGMATGEVAAVTAKPKTKGAV
jgi:hypothetical protein